MEAPSARSLPLAFFETLSPLRSLDDLASTPGEGLRKAGSFCLRWEEEQKC